jgi:NAD(P)H-flavin reductase/ferredoxin
MSKLCSVTVNGECFPANPGDVLLDAALINGIDVPHDCRSGQCGTCVVRLLAGRTLAGEGVEPGTVHACQARILSDLNITFDEVPSVRTSPGEVTAVRDLTCDVAEVTIELKRSIPYLPGQYFNVQYASFPPRAYSPTVSLVMPRVDDVIRFHVRRVEGGCVSSQLGFDIRAGHRVKLRGPYGSAHFRRGHSNRLVLVSGGTGFAPIWAILDAALRESPIRPIALVVGARSLGSLYMAQALELASSCQNVAISIATEQPQSFSEVFRTGRPSDFLPDLYPHDVVYAAGPLGLVEAVSVSAARARAPFYADPFVANGTTNSPLLDRLARWRRATGRERTQPQLGAGLGTISGLRQILRDIDYPEPVLRDQRI